MNEVPDVERLRSDIAEVKASQAFFHEAVGEMKVALNSTSRELHEAALVLERVAIGMEGGARRIDKLENDCNEHSDRIDSLESTRDKQSGMLAIIGLVAGMIGSGVIWLLNHFFK